MEFVHPEDRHATESEALNVNAGLVTASFANRYQCKDGSYKWLLWNSVSFPDRQEIYAVARDITEHKRAEEAMRASEAWYRVLFDANPLPMWVYAPATLQFLAVNDAAVEHYGYSREEFLAMSIKDIRPEEDIPALIANVAKPSQRYEKAGTWRHLKKDGTIIDVEVTSHDLVFAGRQARFIVANDVTQKKRVEAQLLRAQRMDTIGTLAGALLMI